MVYRHIQKWLESDKLFLQKCQTSQFQNKSFQDKNSRITNSSADTAGVQLAGRRWTEKVELWAGRVSRKHTPATLRSSALDDLKFDVLRNTVEKIKCNRFYHGSSWVKRFEDTLENCGLGECRRWKQRDPLRPDRFGGCPRESWCIYNFRHFLGRLYLDSVTLQRFSRNAPKLIINLHPKKISFTISSPLHLTKAHAHLNFNFHCNSAQNHPGKHFDLPTIKQIAHLVWGT